MSLDISLHLKPDIKNADGSELGEEVVSMNWLRNPFGLCNWAENMVEALGHKPEKDELTLWYVCNNWNYDKAKDVDRELFKKVVDYYWEILQPCETGFFFFDVNEYIQFVEPKRHLFPTEELKFIGPRIPGTNHDIPHKIGLPMHYFNESVISLGVNATRHHDDLAGFDKYLEHYTDWFLELVNFANDLQNPEYLFYCSN